MNKTLLLMLLLVVHTPMLPESEVLNTFRSIVTHKNTECIIGLILGATLCKNNNTFSQVLSVTLFLASLGLYVSDYQGFSDACKHIYKSLTR
jgi:hypothetical protein